jgi:hypothetical protein
VKAEVSAAGTRTPEIAALDEKRRFAWKAALRKRAGYCSGDVDLSDEEIARRVEAYEPPSRSTAAT